jgi:WD40 repeat protein
MRPSLLPLLVVSLGAAIPSPTSAQNIKLPKVLPGLSTATTVAFNPDGKTVAGADFDGTLKLWDVATEKELANLRGHNKAVFCVAFSRDGKLLASGGRDGTVRLWEVATGKEQSKFQDTGPVWAVAFGGESNLLASLSPSLLALLVRGEPAATVTVRDVSTGEKRTTFADGEGLPNMAFSADGKWLAVGVECQGIVIAPPCAYGTLRRVSSTPPSKGTPSSSTAWRSARIANCWPREMEILAEREITRARCASGTLPRARNCPSSKGIER